ncbi:hypothetical protein BT93_B0863 [Corymbia citriodora subsp. variegata]|nr:hypothetical protein BT93_B0863 [Corymbia citriodora subsp. variegata]
MQVATLINLLLLLPWKTLILLKDHSKPEERRWWELSEERTRGDQMCKCRERERERERDTRQQEDRDATSNAQNWSQKAGRIHQLRSSLPTRR